MMRKLQILIFLIVAASGIGAAEYSLEECFDSVLRNDYALSLIDNEILKKKLDQKDAVSSWFPVIGSSASFGYKSEVAELDLSSLGMMGAGTVELGTDTTYDLTLNVNQLIFNGFSRKYTRMLTEVNLDRELWNKQLRIDAVNQMILQLAYSYTLSELNIEALSTSIKRLGINLNQVKLFAEQGFSSELDLLDIRSKLKEMEQQKLSLENGRTRVITKISELTGLEDIDSLAIPSEYMEVLSSDNLDGFKKRLEDNGELMLFDITERQLELKRKISLSEYYPEISGTGGMHYGLPGANFVGTDWQLYFTVGVKVNFNIWEGGRRSSEIERNSITVNQNRISRNERMNALYYDTLMKINELKSLGEQRLQASDIFTLKQKKYELVENLWRAGQKSTLDVLTAEQEYTEADIREKSLRVQYLSLYQQILFNLNESMWSEK